MGNLQLDYSPKELLADAEYAEPLFAAGRRCHGGFDADGTYVSPRTLNRMPAIAAWKENHVATSGNAILEIPLETWPEQYPNLAQSRFLLEQGVREPIVTILTRIGTVEGFGAMLRFALVPNIQNYFEDDVSGTATAHLEHGLFEAHARDEAGYIGTAGHDEMWYAARDIAFEHPVTTDQTAIMLERIGISSGGSEQPDPETLMQRAMEMRQFADLDLGVEMLLHRMLSLLFIEIQAFHTFAWAEDLLADTRLCAGEGEAARLVSFIRQDETPHVEYLRTSLSEMRVRNFRSESGGAIPGELVVDQLWDFHLNESIGQRRQDFLEIAAREVEHALDGHPRGGEILEEFHRLGSVRPGPDGKFAA